jgi:hypothetical protein
MPGSTRSGATARRDPAATAQGEQQPSGAVSMARKQRSPRLMALIEACKSARKLGGLNKVDVPAEYVHTMSKAAYRRLRKGWSYEKPGCGDGAPLRTHTALLAAAWKRDIRRFCRAADRSVPQMSDNIEELIECAEQLGLDSEP